VVSRIVAGVWHRCQAAYFEALLSPAFSFQDTFYFYSEKGRLESKQKEKERICRGKSDESAWDEVLKCGMLVAFILTGAKQSVEPSMQAWFRRAFAASVFYVQTKFVLAMDYWR